MTCFITRSWVNNPYFHTYHLQDREQVVLSSRQKTLDLLKEMVA